MIVWGIDASSKCGLAIWDTARDPSSAHCEVIEVKDSGYYFYAANMGRKLRECVEEFGMPSLVVVEQGSESTQGTSINGIIWSWNCIGAVMSFLGVCEVPIATIYPATWRKPFYGKNFDCPQEPVLETVYESGQKVRRQVIEKGKPKFKNDWKTAAVQKCESMGITLPPQKGISHNAAEAFGIAHSWAHAAIIADEFEDTFTRLKKENDRFKASQHSSPRTDDLFAGAAA